MDTTLDRNAGKKTNIDTRNFGSTATRVLLQDRRRVVVLVDLRLALVRSTGIADMVVVVSDEIQRLLHPPVRIRRRRCGERSLLQRHRAILAGAKSISSDAFGGGSNRSNDNDDGFGWDANRYAGESGFGSSDIRRGGTSPRGDDLDLTASDLMEKISFQAVLPRQKLNARCSRDQRFEEHGEQHL